MARRRYVFTENGIPLAKPREVILDDAPAANLLPRDQIPVWLPDVRGSRAETSLTATDKPAPSAEHWVDFDGGDE